MKFGKSLPRNQVPEWSSSYIDYKGLKKHIKAAISGQRTTGEADLAPFFFELDRNLELVDSFFNKRLAEYQRRLNLLHGRYDEHFDGLFNSENKSDESTEVSNSDTYGLDLDRDDVAELLGALLELRSGLRKLQWYGEVNRRGFVKILKKTDKKANLCAQRRYLESKVNTKPFASAAGVILAMQQVNHWLSKIGGTEALEIDNNTRLENTGIEPRRIAFNSIAPDMIDRVGQCLHNDTPTGLSDVITEVQKTPVSKKILLALLQRATVCKARKCIDLLLGYIDTLHEEEDINDRNVIHRLVISIGRHKNLLNEPSISPIPDPFNISKSQSSLQVSEPIFITPAESPISSPPISLNTSELDGTLKLTAHDESVKILEYLLQKLRVQQRPALEARDSYGRTPLHYAAQFGFVVICRLIIKFMRQWGQFDVSEGIDSPRWQDNDGLAPLHLAVMGEHPKTTRILLLSEGWDGELGTSDRVVLARKAVSKSSVALALAAKKNAVVIVKLLVEAGVDINYQDENGETALHHASRLGHVECVRVLLEGSDTQRADVELAEKNYGWTPLFVAAVEGKEGVVDLLIENGESDVDKHDLSGWSAKEHAALRGHLSIARKLARASNTTESSGSVSPSLSSSPLTPPTTTSLSGSLGTNGSNFPGTQSPPVKSFGHRYLKAGETMILVNLGSMDTRKDVPAVQLDKIPLAEAHLTQLDTALSLVVSAQNAIGEPTVVDLPAHSNIATDDPIVFETKDVSKVKLTFDIVPTYAGSKDQIVGRAVALLSSIKPELGKRRVSLQGGVQVPILGANLEIIGCLNFEFMIVTPFAHPNMEITKQQTYWKSLAIPRVIGHRGLGKNFPARKSLQLGENTILSFIAAANLGAEYIEFDVQLTKDHVPVIYHDFLVGETGIDAPLHTLTLEQFMSMSRQPTQKSRKGSPERVPNGNRTPGEDGTREGGSQHTLRRHRSMSLHDGDDTTQADFAERMKHTRAYKLHGFKGNSRGHSISAPFATLESAFKDIPVGTGFNIELKYPMLQETEDQDMDTLGIEMNSWVDSVLKVVYDHGNGRDLIFSSFNPDICLLLSLKQPSIPILFLTEGGTQPMADIRASGLQEAIRFASRWNLLGIVSAVEPLVICPRLIKVIKESGLVCVTYGIMNNLPANVKLQTEQGVDAVIVDNVLAIRKGLTHEAKKLPEAL
ncbi:glycerophosphocholine phosphodiesterase [Choiromyces venosus 120613-1]|uniref:Glycerophosphocholine phosphodiesterase n=1 Tax=Choiromyces venosus 120613-1 TaxID=1336337 RepID=A0A3N4J933_9PEZI|nr:glycerophosphocholine phosphodiesterase [Choiromyces venosus 120613-1]